MPLLVVIGWLIFGPRNRVTVGDVGRFMIVAVIWLIYTLIRGAFVDWYPYPFVDVIVHGYPQVLATSLGVGLMMVGLGFLAWGLDGRPPTGDYDEALRRV